MQSRMIKQRKWCTLEVQSPSPLKISLHADLPVFQVKVICPQCGGEGFSFSNMIDLKIILNTPLCWKEECCFCGKTFFANNGHPDVCKKCLNYLACFECGAAVVEIQPESYFEN